MLNKEPANEDETLNLDKLIQIDMLNMLYTSSFPAVLMSLLASVGMVSILWPYQEHSVLLLWLVVLYAVSIIRIVLFLLYKRAAPEGLELLAWEVPYFITLILTSLAWGVGALFIMPADSNVHQVMVYCVLVGFSGGALSYFSSHRAITITTILCMLLPTTLWFLIRGTPEEMKLTIFALLFFVSALRTTKTFSTALYQNFSMTHQLEVAAKNAEKLASIDELTTLFNRRAFYEKGRVLVNHCQRNNEMLSTIELDIDKFKIINDSFGHAAGDMVLAHIGTILKQRLRKSDIAARIGGEEFGILLATLDLDGAIKVAEELRKAIEEATVIYNGENIKITASFGVTNENSDIDTLIKHADAAMYRAKESGRNCVVSY